MGLGFYLSFLLPFWNLIYSTMHLVITSRIILVLLFITLILESILYISSCLILIRLRHYPFLKITSLVVSREAILLVSQIMSLFMVLGLVSILLVIFCSISTSNYVLLCFIYCVMNFWLILLFFMWVVVEIIFVQIFDLFFISTFVVVVFEIVYYFFII